MSLTKEDIQALKHATTIVVHIADHKARVQLTEKITARKRGVELSTEREHAIDATGHVGWHDGTKATFVTLYARRVGAWQALGMLVRPSDELVFEAMNNSNDYLRMAEIPAQKWPQDREWRHPDYDGLYCDTLFVSVRRNRKEVLHHLEVESSIGPNNSARCIR